MIVEVFEGHQPGQVVAFIDKKIAFFDGIQPKVGERVDVMIIRVKNPRDPFTQKFDNKIIIAFFIRVVEPDDVLVPHHGFILRDSGTTYAAAVDLTSPRMITPGRLQFALPIATARDEPLSPGHVYIKRRDLYKRACRIEGVPSHLELLPAPN